MCLPENEEEKISSWKQVEISITKQMNLWFELRWIVRRIKKHVTEPDGRECDDYK